MSTPATSAPAVPWDVRDLLRLCSIDGAALATVLGGWWAASATTRASSQISAAGIAIAAVVAIGASNCRWLLIGRRTIVARRRAVCELLAETTGAIAQRTPLLHSGATSVGAMGLVALPGGTRFHRRGCQLVVGKSTLDVDPEENLRKGRRPCGVCSP